MDGHDFHKLILAELDAVFRLACHLTRTRQEADDCVQETYLRALKSANTFTLAGYGVRPWLFTILHNVIHTRYAKIAREHAVLEDFQNQATVASISECDLPVNWDEIDERLKHAIGQLSVTFREVFLLSAVEGLKYREIAKVIDVPVGTVMSRLSRARAMLVQQLSDLASEQRLGPASPEDSSADQC